MIETPIAPSGEVIASGIAFEDFLTQFDGQHVEWINGDVITMSPVNVWHNDLSVFLIALLDIFLSMGPGGRILHRPFVMQPQPNLPARAPDITVVLLEHSNMVQEYVLAGPADLVLEIVSLESHRRDRVEKFAEYEKGGVPEYWILDRERREALFYSLNAQGMYEPLPLDSDGLFNSRVLPGLRIAVETFWQEPLPGTPDIVKLVEAMLQS